jgi:hypothetical protein
VWLVFRVLGSGDAPDLAIGGIEREEILAFHRRLIDSGVMAAR